MKLPANFAEKRVTLVADTPTDVAFGPAEFEAHTGVAELTRPVSVQIDMTNDINYAVTVSMRYETRVDVTPLLDSKANRAVPPNSSLRVNAVNLPSLANIRPRCERIVVTLRSLGSGTVTVRLRLDEAQQASAEGGGQLGVSGSVFGEYEPFGQTYIYVNSISLENGTLYTVPPGRRAIIDTLSVWLTETPIQRGNVQVEVTTNVSGAFLLQASSDALQSKTVSINPPNLILNTGSTIDYQFESQKPNLLGFARLIVFGREVSE